MERERCNLRAGLEQGKKVESEPFARVVVVEVRRVVAGEVRRVVVEDTIEWEPAAGSDTMA